MKATRLDRRVRKEARLLLKHARSRLRRGKSGSEEMRASRKEELNQAIARVDRALERDDLAGVRANLPELDAIVDDVAAGEGKSTIREYIESIGVAIAIALLLRAFVVEAFKIPSSSMIPTMEIGDHIFVNKFIYGVRIPWTRTKLFEVRKPRRGEVFVFMNPCTPDKDFIKRIVALEGDTVEVRCTIVYVNGKPIPRTHVPEAACTYDDYENGEWKDQACSRYRETIGDETFDIFEGENQPQRDAERLALGDTGEYKTFKDDRQDFPSEGPLNNPPRLLPGCPPGDDGREKPRLGKIQQSPPSGSTSPCRPQWHYVVPADHVFVMGDNRANSKDAREFGPVPLDNIKGKAMFIWWSSGESVRFGRMGKFVHD
jgi:signal peptidase I